jgi:CheY-like chemotaxis protein
MNKYYSHRLKVLIVEDDYVFGLGLQIQLEELGYDVFWREDDGARALQIIGSESPDLIFIDIDLQGSVSGYDIANKIKHMNIPILFFTSKNDKYTCQQTRETNMVGYLQQPIEKNSLCNTILMAIHYAHSKFQEKNKNEDLNADDLILTENYFYYKQKDIYKKVLTRDVTFVETKNNYCEIITKTGNVFVARVPTSVLSGMFLSNFELDKENL